MVKFSRRVCQFYDNDSNPNMFTNGEFRLLKLIAKSLDQNKVILDVGANVGSWSLAVRQAGLTSHIYAFDPLKKNVSQFEALLPQLQKASIHCFGLSDANSQSEFFVNEDAAKSGHDSIYDMHAIGYTDETSKLSIDLRTLDSVVAELGIGFASFMKIDVEGHELRVLKGAESTIRDGKIDFVQFEFGHAAKVSRVFLYDFVSFFSLYNYRLFVIKPKGVELLRYSPWIENRYSYGNFLAISPLVGSDLIERISL
jgi:FkbM family methyltransferase